MQNTPRELKRKAGLATKRSELLLENPIIPNINVGSKLKEMLGQQQQIPSCGVKRKKVGKWDEIMKNINEHRVETPKTYDNVKSKVFADFKPTQKNTK